MAGVLLPGSARPGGGDIEGVTAGDGLSGGGSSGSVTVTLDLNELTAAAVADGDFIAIIDANDSNASRKEAVADLATLFAGDGLTASSSVLAVNVDDSTIETNSDAIRIKADGVAGAQIADDAIDSEHYTDGSIDTAHIADNQVTAAKIFDLARGSILYGNASAATAELTKGSANTVLTSDGTDISWAAAGGGGGLDEYDIWSLSSNGSDTTEAALDTNLIRWAPSIDSENAFEKIGTGMTKSSGNFTFPSTGKYEVIAQAAFSGQSGGNDQVYCIIHHTVNSTKEQVAIGASYRQGSSQTTAMAGPALLDIRDTADTVQLQIDSHDAYGGVVNGHATLLYTFIAFKKIGDT